jgi:hypothetical protein
MSRHGQTADTTEETPQQLPDKPGRVVFLDRFFRVAVLAIITIFVTGPLLLLYDLSMFEVILFSAPLMFVLALWWVNVLDVHRKLNNSETTNWILLVLFNALYATVYYRVRLRPELMALYADLKRRHAADDETSAAATNDTTD